MCVLVWWIWHMCDTECLEITEQLSRAGLLGFFHCGVQGLNSVISVGSKLFYLVSHPAGPLDISVCKFHVSAGPHRFYKILLPGKRPLLFLENQNCQLPVTGF